MADLEYSSNILSGIAEAMQNVEQLNEDQGASREALAAGKKTLELANAASADVLTGIANAATAKENQIKAETQFELASIADQVTKEAEGRATEEAIKAKRAESLKIAEQYQDMASEHINLTQYKDKDGNELGFFGKVGAFFNKENNFRKALTLNQQAIDYKNSARADMQTIGLVKSQTVQSIQEYNKAEENAAILKTKAGEVVKLATNQIAKGSAEYTQLAADLGLSDKYFDKVVTIFDKQKELMGANLQIAGSYISMEQLNMQAEAAGKDTEAATKYKEMLKADIVSWNNINPNDPIKPDIVNTIVDSKGSMKLDQAAALLGQNTDRKLAFFGSHIQGSNGHAFSSVPQRLATDSETSTFRPQYDTALKVLSTQMPNDFNMQQAMMDELGVTDSTALGAVPNADKQRAYDAIKGKMANRLEQLKEESAAILAASTGSIVMSEALALELGYSEEFAARVTEFTPEELRDGSILTREDLTKQSVAYMDSILSGSNYQMGAKPNFNNDEVAAAIDVFAKQMAYLARNALKKDFGQLYGNKDIDKLPMNIIVTDDSGGIDLDITIDVTDPTSLSRLLNIRKAKKARYSIAPR